MLYFKVEGDFGIRVQVLEVSEEHQDRRDGWLNRNDFKTFAQAEEIAQQASAYLNEGLFLACDNGSHISPRYDVIRAPRVGQPVSQTIGGDYYPDGYIVKVSGTNCSRVYTDTGSKYNRRRKTSGWKLSGSPSMGLVIGEHIDERNPSF